LQTKKGFLGRRRSQSSQKDLFFSTSKKLDEEPHAHEFLENSYQTGAAQFVEGLLTFFLSGEAVSNTARRASTQRLTHHGSRITAFFPLNSAFLFLTGNRPLATGRFLSVPCGR